MAWDVAKGLLVIAGFFLMAFTIGFFVGVACSEQSMWREAEKRGHARLVQGSGGSFYVWEEDIKDEPKNPNN